MSFSSEHPTRPPDDTVRSSNSLDPDLVPDGATNSASLHREPLASATAIDTAVHGSRDDLRMSEPAENPAGCVVALPDHPAREFTSLAFICSSATGLLGPILRRRTLHLTARAHSHTAPPPAPHTDVHRSGPPIARSPSATSRSRTPVAPLAPPDREVRPSSPPHRDAGQPSSPPRPRMRRVPRQSPNARNERPAPSTLPASGFAANNSGASGSSFSRPLRRRDSMPTVATGRRARASSLDATSAAPRRAGQSRVGGSSSGSTPAHRDPDEHWLSEDEAADSARSANQARQPLRRRRSGGGSDGGGDSEDPGRKVLNALDLGIRTVPGARIHHRPAKHFNITPANEPVEHAAGAKLPELVPQLARILTCPACHHLLRDPATLACGHSRCLHCSPPPKHLFGAQAADRSVAPTELEFAASEHQVPPPALAPQTVAPVLITTEDPMPSPGGPTQLDTRMLYRTLSSTSIASTPSVASAAHSNATEASQVPIHGEVECADPACKYNFSHLIVPHRPLRIDYTLRKIVDTLRRAVFGIDEYVAAVEAQSSKERHGEVLTPLFSSVRLGSEAPPAGMSSGLVSNMHDSPPEPGVLKRDDSGSSGGGEDEPIAEDETKRARKTTGAWRSSKKTRAGVDEDAEMPTFSPEPSTAPRPGHAPAAAAPALPQLSLISPTIVADLQAECECQVCFQLYHEPVTSPCGHSFCRGCLARAYDHSDKCPLCRSDLPPLAYFRWQRSSAALSAVITTALPILAAERLAAVQEDEKALLAQVPIFVCTSAWPGIKCFLHIFEPRYRLMIRRALESPERSFGMVLPLRNGPSPDAVNAYGTMLRITSCQMLEDGRLILETVGTYRFRLLERSMLDGYNVGRVERVDDVSPEQEAELEAIALAQNDSPEFQELWSQPDDPARAPTIGDERPSRPPMTGNMELSTDQLMEICFDFIRTLRGQSAPWILERLNRTGKLSLRSRPCPHTH